MDPQQLADYVVKPVLRKLGLYSLAAERLVIGTIYQESHGRYLKQLGNGPAVGVIQMEPATYSDIWNNYLAYKRTLANKVTEFASVQSLDDDMCPAVDELIGNVSFAVAMCRVHYLRVKAPLPDADDIEALARYWKKYYNTELGKGTPAEFVRNFPKVLL